MIRRSLTALALGFTLAAAPAALGKNKQPVAPAAAPLSSYVNPDPSVEPENILALDLSNGGRVLIRLMPAWAPGHIERIKTLVGQGFYNGIVFHRVIDGFMAQTGCPHGTGTGGSKLADLPAEFNAEPHVRGVCSMARASSPNSANSQFFICFDDARFLDRQYTVWGKVIEGMENVDKIKRGEPVQNPDKMIKMQVAADVK
jgi:peptidylprolyl isomerase